MPAKRKTMVDRQHDEYMAKLGITYTSAHYILESHTRMEYCWFCSNKIHSGVVHIGDKDHIGLVCICMACGEAQQIIVKGI